MKGLFLTVLLLLTGTATAGIIPPSIDGLPESGDSFFTYTDASLILDDSNATTTFVSGGFNTFDYEVGFYTSAGGGTIIDMLALFDNSFSAGQESNIVWDFSLNTASTIFGTIGIAGDGTDMFGMYFRSDGDYFYSDALLNPNQEDLFGFYWETNPFVDRNLVVYGSDNDTGSNLDEWLMDINDVQPVLADIDTDVPEPSTIAVLSLGLFGLALRKRNA